MKKHLLLSLLCIFIISAVAQTSDNTYHFKFKKGKYYLVHPNGKKVKCDPFTFASSFSEGLAVVEKDLEFGYIDSIGQMVIDYQYYDAGPFINGITYAAKDGKYGYINKSGQFIVKPQFDLAYSFEEEHGIVKGLNPDTVIYGPSPMIKGLVTKEGQLIGDALYTSILKEDMHFRAYKGDSLFHIAFDGTKKFINANIEVHKDSLFEVVEEMPEYPGGEMGLRRFIATNVRYPIGAQQHGVQGRCYITYVVDETGDIIDIKPAMPAPPILMNESLRVIAVMPKWKPGKIDGEPVKVSYTVPVNFVLQ
ncbi:WG repeat-containing protein [Carboxylicivirga marina]|uniref:WG repeat-containing protein n=1 Tax=Carboxylicivirga marina TaxID=2800988 RepID=A0ABS1HM78_9BACT|nr:WG repeat-containing protein [Carboxylicivirga marina]MBK3518726.1 WG repeat-containing protein [Carboxylicivirga marina]